MRSDDAGDRRVGVALAAGGRFAGSERWRSRNAETARAAANVDGGAPALRCRPRSLLSLPAPRQSPPPDEYKLRRATDGSGDLIYEANGFYANVARDGAVRFRDRHVTNLKFLPFLPVAGARPGVPSLEDVVRSLRGRRRGDPNAPSPPRIRSRTRRCRRARPFHASAPTRGRSAAIRTPVSPTLR